MATISEGNTLIISDGESFPTACKTTGNVSIYPSSPDSGLAAIYTSGNSALMLTREDVKALRDWLNLALGED